MVGGVLRTSDTIRDENANPLSLNKALPQESYLPGALQRAELLRASDQTAKPRRMSCFARRPLTPRDLRQTVNVGT